MSRREEAVKRLFDVAASALGLFILSPLLATIVIAVRATSRGPAIFRQERLGKNGVPFIIFKFRTMRVGAADIRNPDGSTFNAQKDPRLTPIGTFLRSTSLDELPQLWNVLRNDMSLVGPRPDLVHHIEMYTKADMEKLAVRPGITGYTAVVARNGVSWAERKRLDVLYVRNRSLWIDLKILLLTVPAVLMKRGVYVSATSRKSAKLF